MPQGLEKKFATGKHHATPIDATHTPAIHTEVPRTWYPSKTEQDSILTNNGITSNWKYRKHLMANAVDAIKDNHHRCVGMTGMTQYSYDTVPEDRRSHVAGMIVGHGMGESGDMRRSWMAKNGGNASNFAPHIVMRDQGVKPHE
jgi:hypothetical protein